MFKTIRARIIHTKADACSCGILLERGGWPSVYLDFFLDRTPDQVEGPVTARFEAAGFGRIGECNFELQSTDGIISGPLHCLGEPKAVIHVSPVGRHNWAEIEKCQDLALSIEPVEASVQGTDTQTIRSS